MNQSKVATQNIDYMPTFCRYLLFHVEFEPENIAKVILFAMFGVMIAGYTCQIFCVCDFYSEHVFFRITGVWGGFP